MAGNCSPLPFSALAACMQSEEKSDFSWDEFGFLVEERGAEPGSSRLLVPPSREERPGEVLQWTVELELGEAGPAGPRLERLVRTGIPHSLRPRLWPRLLNCAARQERVGRSYPELLAAGPGPASPTAQQIEKDLLRTLPTNFCFRRPDSVGVPRLRRVLRALATLCPDIGYCQVYLFRDAVSLQLQN